MWEVAAHRPAEAARAAFAAARARPGTVAVVVLAGVALALAINSRAPERAAAVVTFVPLDRSTVLIDVGVAGQPLPDEVQLLSDSIMQRMLDEGLAPRYRDVDDLRGKLSAREEQKGGPTTELRAEADKEKEAIAAVEVWIGALARTRTDTVNAQFGEVEQALRTRLRSTEGAAQRRALRSRIAELEVRSASLPTPVQVTEGVHPIGKATVVPVVPALVASLLAGLLIAFARDLRRGELRTPGMIGAAMGLPVLGTPADHLFGRLALITGSEPAAILVTSAEARHGREEVALGLARQSGGGGSVLVWRDPASVAQLEGAARGVRVLGEDGDLSSLRRQLSDRVSAGETVVVLAPAFTESPEALLAACEADAWLVCAAVGQTQGDEALALGEALEGLPVPPGGVVVTDLQGKATKALTPPKI